MTDVAEDVNPRAACNLYTFFWIDWADGSIKVGERELVGDDPFMTYSDSDMTLINHFMISTGSGDTGEWNLGKLSLVVRNTGLRGF